MSLKSAALAASVSALALSLSAPEAAARPMEIEDLSSIRNVGQVVLSDDGETIAYTVSKPRDVLEGDEDGPADSHLYVGDVPFVTGQVSVSGVSFAPDGASLYFRAARGEDARTALHEISLSGGEAREAFAFESRIGDYAVSPDGGTLYFVATEGEDETQSKLADKGFRARLYEEDLEFAHLRKVSLTDPEAEPELVYADEHVSDIALSSDGSRIVAAVAPTPLVDDALMARDLVVIDTGSGDVTAMIDTPGKLDDFEISPGGDTLAFLGGRDIHDTSAGILMLASLSDGEITQLTPEAEQHIQDLTWLGDDEILVNAHRGIESALVVHDREGEVVRTLDQPGDLVARSIAAAGGRVVISADGPTHPRELFEIGEDTATQLSDFNAWTRELDLAAQTGFSYEARDGETVEGALIVPEGEAPEGGWPLIVYVHGGPEAHVSDGWVTYYSMPGQIAAGEGFAVFHPNYRGSTGRGVEFAVAHQDDYAGKEFNDLEDGVEALAEEGIIDARRAGITGGSYGGYASMWGATALTDTFAASVAFVGISNQVSKFGTGDIPNEMYLVHSRRWPWEDNWVNLLRRSPVFHAGKSRTPTLIMHGEEDTRVDPGQSLELYRSLKVRTDTPVRLVFYPGEGHGNRKAAARLDYAKRLHRWMGHYLGDGDSRLKPKPDFDLGLAETLGLAEPDEGGGEEADSDTDGAAQ